MMSNSQAVVWCRAVVWINSRKAQIYVVSFGRGRFCTSGCSAGFGVYSIWIQTELSRPDAPWLALSAHVSLVLDHCITSHESRLRTVSLSWGNEQRVPTIRRDMSDTTTYYSETGDENTQGEENTIKCTWEQDCEIYYVRCMARRRYSAGLRLVRRVCITTDKPCNWCHSEVQRI